MNCLGTLECLEKDNIFGKVAEAYTCVVQGKLKAGDREMVYLYDHKHKYIYIDCPVPCDICQLVIFIPFISRRQFVINAKFPCTANDACGFSLLGQLPFFIQGPFVSYLRKVGKKENKR